MKRLILIVAVAIVAIVIVRATVKRAPGGSVRTPTPPEVSERPLRRIVFVGVDGADWIVINDLVEKGRLPNFARLLREGATGDLRSIEPMLSPLLWTTMATGKLPEEHGILNFTVVDPTTGERVPITRLYRKVDALWNMLSDYGRTVDIVGWLATFPAEPINGVMVTDRLGYLAYAGEGEKATRGSVSPVEKHDEIAGLVVESSTIEWGGFRRFVDMDRASFLESRALPFDPENAANNMIMLFASTLTFDRIAKHLIARRPDFLAVYFELVDATKHLFMHYTPPRQPEIDDARFAMYKNAVEEAYVLQDSIIGEYMSMCDEGAVLIVASDHGFKSGSARPKLRPEIWAGKAAFWHRLEGVICLFGDGILPGARIVNASILDVAPTVLALQGLPRVEDLPGRVLDEAFDASLRSSFSDRVVPTLQRQRETDELASSTGDAATDEALKKLEALGYITPQNPDALNNLGQRLQKQGRFIEAIEEFKKAIELRPNFAAAWNNLGVCYGKLRRYDEAEAALERAIELNPADVQAMNNLAVMFMELGRMDDALAMSERSIDVEPNYANGRLTLGAIRATMGDLEAAEAEFLRVLELDPSNGSARSNLEKVRRLRNAN